MYPASFEEDASILDGDWLSGTKLEGFSYPDFEEILWLAARLSPDSLQVSSAKNRLTSEEISRTDIIKCLPKLLDDGFSIAVNYVERFSSSIATYLDHIGHKFNCVANGSVFLSPPSAGIFAPHYDSIDVIAIQLKGSKIWKIDNSPTTLPLVNHTYPVDHHSDSSVEYILKSGDGLYIPRGKIHDVKSSSDTFSLHLSAGLATLQHHEVLKRHIHILAEKSVLLRRSIPANAKQEASFTYETSDVAGISLNPYELKIAEESLRASILSKMSQPPGRIEEIIFKWNTASNHWIRRIRCEVTREFISAGEVGIGFPGLAKGRFSQSNAFLVMPIKALPSLEYIRDTEEPFSVEDLPGVLEDDEKRVLLNRLLEEGLLSTA